MSTQELLWPGLVILRPKKVAAASYQIIILKTIIINNLVNTKLLTNNKYINKSTNYVYPITNIESQE